MSQPRGKAGKRPFIDQERCDGTAIEGRCLSILIINLNYILDWFGLVQRETQKLFSKIIDGSPATLDKIKLISKEILRLKLVVQNEVMDFFLHDNFNVHDLILMLNLFTICDDAGSIIHEEMMLVMMISKEILRLIEAHRAK